MKLSLFKGPLGSAKKGLPAVIVDLLTGETRKVERVPYIIGSTAGADWQIDSFDGNLNEIHFAKDPKGPGFVICPNYQSEVPMLVDGSKFEDPMPIPFDRGVILKINSKLFCLKMTKDPEAFVKNLELNQWILFDGVANRVLGKFPFAEIPAALDALHADFFNCAISLNNTGSAGTWLNDLTDLLQPVIPILEENIPAAKQAPLTKVEATASDNDINDIPSDVGEFQCPICWLHFEGRHIKHISTHQDLLGDPVLGNSEHRRFVPNKWDSSGVALDDYGVASPDTACPHCHQRLPAGFGEFKQFIFSIVGAPSAGKSYYLAILIKQLKKYLFHNFEISFLDQDPEYNSGINEVINTLFTAKTALEGRIRKTDLRGNNYKEIVRNGEYTSLPRPYIFNISLTNVENTDSSLVFYDNAGEHFLPTYSGAEDYQILHVAKASTLFFLYDPLVNIEIRSALVDLDSDQLKLASAADQQSTILSQMNVKISRALGKPTSKRLEHPLALIVGKFDLWRHILSEDEKIVNPLTSDRVLSMKGVENNSIITRNFLNKFAPDIVATAERLSSNIRYFPVSSFGHSPKQHTVYDLNGQPQVLADGTFQKEVAPEPTMIKPVLIEIPTLWALSQTVSDLIPEKTE